MNAMNSLRVTAATVKVDIANFAFSPDAVTINVGDTVTWTQRDFIGHTVTSDTGLWNSPLLSSGQTFSFTFSNAGTFGYHCTPHPFMVGTVTVKSTSNASPTVNITGPTNNAVVTAPFSGKLQATAADSDGTVASVKFFLGGNSVGKTTSAPFEISVSNLAAGQYNVTAKATDNGGASTTSAPVSFIVNSPPTVSLASPAAGANFTAPATISFQINAADPDGSVEKVEIYVGTNVIATLNAPPFAFTWTNVVAGSYTVFAEAADNHDAETSSPPISITVSQAAGPIKIAEIEDKGIGMTLSWDGGKAPYLVQMKSSLSDPAWFNVLTTDDTEVTVVKEPSAAFYRVQDQAQNSVLAFTALLSGDAEVPPVTASAMGTGTLALEGNKLSYRISYDGLSGPASAAHIHGPADALSSAAPIIPFSGPFGSSGILTGSVTLSADQTAALKAGKTYVNFHTAANGGGEIRGQIVPLQLHAVLAGTTEVPPVTTSAKGEATVTLVGNRVLFDIDYDDLSSDPTAAHLHGPASATQAAAPIIPLPPPSGKSGSIYSAASLTPQQLVWVLSGQTYLNIHTKNNAGGEIRGQVLP